MSSHIRINLSLPLLHQGKVKDIYDIDSQYMLIVATDRLSAFDVIFEQPIASKGKILTEIANFWFDKTKHIVQNHLTKIKLEEVLTAKEVEMLSGRAIVVKKLKPLPVEAVVRGYLIGSGWKEYQESQSVCGIALPEDLRLASRLEKPIFTPSSKAAVGEHDANISFEKVEGLIGAELAKEMKEVSLEIYKFASKLAIEKGIIIADTKFEFGLDSNDQLTLMDEVLTPDSSRFWSLSDYTPGISPKSFDKQIIRDYLETLDWNKAPPAPEIPQKILRQAANKYMDIQSILCN